MTRHKKFETEAELCAAFIGWAKEQGATCYEEWRGWDIVVVLGDGQQIGIQAKLRLNDAVMLQALPSFDYNQRGIGPDFCAVLVPEAPDARVMIAHALGLLCFDARGWGFFPSLMPCRSWLDWNPAKRLDLPETATGSVAGSPCPVTLTPWKEKALRVIAEVEIHGSITAKRMRELGVDPSRWMTGRWLEPSGVRGNWKRGDACPPFDKQHAEAYLKALEAASRDADQVKHAADRSAKE